MKLTPANLYITKHNGYCVNIQMPDDSRNFLHNEPVKSLIDAIFIMGSIDGDTEINHSNTIISEDGDYFRIKIELTDGQGNPQIFHSRKLNLNDVVYEFNQVVMYDAD